MNTIAANAPREAPQSKYFPAFEVTLLEKAGGPLTKSIKLGDDGRLISDGSACVMSCGTARRRGLRSLDAFADLIGGLEASQAIALGSLREDLPDLVAVGTKHKLATLPEIARGKLIARTGNYIEYAPDRPALALIDIDTKDMPPAVRVRIAEAGGFWNALTTAVPQIANVGRVVRHSTSSGISRTDIGAPIAGSEGLHIFVLIADGADVERFLRTLHDRCWLAGLGWLAIGKAGQLLERSLVDRLVNAPERLVFEGPPRLQQPLAQDQNLRAPVVTDGVPIDTRAACPNLTLVEQARVKDARKAEAFSFGTRASDVKASFICEHAERIVKRTGCPLATAKRMVERQCGGILLPSVELPFDAEELQGKTVADVLADSDAFVGATLADPLEGVSYGRSKAKIMQRADGTVWIHSFAHGRTTYDLKHDAAAVQAAIDAAEGADAWLIVKMMAAADLAEDEEGYLKDRIVQKTGTKLRPLSAMLKAARGEQARTRAEERDAARAALNNDRRVHLSAPASDAERTPVMLALDEVLTQTGEDEPPMRNLDGQPVEVRDRPPSALHELTSGGSNQDEVPKTRLPPPTMPLLTAHDKYSLAHMIERYIVYEAMAEQGGPVPCALAPVFVDHYMNYRDSALPYVSAVVTAPLVLPSGELLAPKGLDRDRKLVFRIASELMALMPSGTPGAAQAAAALDFLANDWLCDVSTDFAGKCVLIVLAMSVLQRVLLPERPAFFVTAGKRGGGKTTAITMLILAVTGKKPAASGWSTNEEERRKAMLAHLAEGIPALVWDNLSLGALISCKTLEAVLTTDSYSDRVLGETRKLTVPAFTVMVFTGNNIGPKGDMASRSLVARLDVDRPDPENRAFKHADPIAWTLDNRGEILRALYTIMLANPRLKTGDRNVKTRFKTWMFLIGTAIESAAATLANQQGRLPAMASPVDFQTLFTAVEADDEDGTGLAEVLDLMRKRWPNDLDAARVARFINDHETHHDAEAEVYRSFLDAALRGGTVSTKSVGRKLTGICDAPVMVGNTMLTLRKALTTGAKLGARYRVEGRQ